MAWLKKISALLFIAFPFFAICGSLPDSITPPRTVYFRFDDFDFFPAALSIPDTSLAGFHNYLRQPGNLFKNLGNPGTPVQGYFYSPPVFKPVYGSEGGFEGYRYSQSAAPVYDTRIPYTDLYYALGSKRVEYLDIIHAQNILKPFGFGVHYNRFAGVGYFPRQGTEFVNAVAYDYYRTRDGLYGILASFYLENYSAEENGGITYDSLFEITPASQWTTVETNIQEAEGRMRSTGFALKQYLNPGRRLPTGDTVHGKPLTLISPFFRIVHSLNYERVKRSYSDLIPNFDYYLILFPVNDTVPVWDTSTTRKFDNALSFIIPPVNDSGRTRYSFSAGVEQKNYFLVQNDLLDTSLSSILLNTRLAAGSGERLSGTIDAHYVISGSGRGRYSTGAILDYSLQRLAAVISLSGGWMEYAPPLQAQVFLNDNISWRNSFRKITCGSGSVSVNSATLNLHLTAAVNSFSNPVYYASYSAIPDQLDQDIMVTRITLKKDFSAGRWNFLNLAVWQDVAGPEIVHVPRWLFKQSTFYENRIFRGALNMQAGIELFWFSAYYADAWMPFTGAFYLQNDTKTGNYPFLDLFLNLKIKTARIFLKAEHINAGLTGTKFYLAPHYPAQGRIIRLGINWRMYE